MNIVLYLHNEKDLDSFEALILRLHKKYTFVSSNQIRAYYYDNLPLKNSCHITVDDGRLSTYNVIYPILKKYNISVTIFVSPQKCKDGDNFWFMDYEGLDEEDIKRYIVQCGYFSPQVMEYPLELLFKELTIDETTDILQKYRLSKKIVRGDRDIVNVDELLEMRDSGLVTIGAHTMNHPILANESGERSEKEITDSIVQLSEMINAPITSFAFPNGLYGLDFGERELTTLKKNGIELAYSVQPGTLSDNKNPLTIPRTCSLKRLKLGYLGLHLPSLHQQKEKRMNIRNFKIV
jgi:peptidoglycan/xylan/chitin deacetylase (PgdA/CDA1 family)